MNKAAKDIGQQIALAVVTGVTVAFVLSWLRKLPQTPNDL